MKLIWYVLSNMIKSSQHEISLKLYASLSDNILNFLLLASSTLRNFVEDNVGYLFLRFMQGCIFKHIVMYEFNLD